MMSRQTALILSKTTSRLLVLVLSAMAAVLVVQAFVGTPSALAIEKNPGRTWNVAGTVFATALSEDGRTLYIGGKFTSVRENPPGVPGDSISVSNVAAIDVATGTAVRTWTPPVTGNGAVVRSLEVKGDRVFIGGNFTAVGGEPRQHLAAVDAADGSVEPFAPRVSKTNDTPYVYALLAGGSKLYVGGFFNNVDGKSRLNLAAFEINDNLGTGALDPAWKPRTTNTDTSNKVRELEFASDGASIFVAGRFNHVTGSDGTQGRRESVARLQTNTGNLHPWKIRDGVIGSPQDGWDLTVTPTMLYGGFGAGPNFAAAFRLDPLNPLLDGTRAWRFSTVGNVQTVALSPDGSRLFLGGHFGTNVLEQQVCNPAQNLSGLVSVNPATGQPYCDWIPQLDPSYKNGNGAWSMTTTGDTHLWVGGGFTHVNGVDQRNLARFALTDAPDPPPPPHPPACTITGTSSAETLIGTSGDDIICGGGGNDTIKGLEGNDTLKGEGSSDRLYGGTGDDTLDGGLGTDTAVFSDSAAAVSASLETNTATGEGMDDLVDVEHLTGSNASDTLTGSDANNILVGGGGNDGIVGLGGADRLLGAAGDDTLDSQDGVEGNDTLDGGGNTDTCLTDATEASILRCEK